MKIKKISLANEIAERIKDSIRDKEWGPEDRLPSENELSEAFGVNRLTVRMALQKLNTLGIVETRVGEGTFVKDFNFGSYIEEVADFCMKPEMLDNVCEFRKMLEVESARLAMERATPEENAELVRLCNRYDDAFAHAYEGGVHHKDRFEALVNADVDFHFQIVRMSHNSLYMYSFMVAREALARYIGIVLSRRVEQLIVSGRKSTPLSDSHRTICTAMARKDLELCKSAYLDMIDYHVEIA